MSDIFDDVRDEVEKAYDAQFLEDSEVEDLYTEGEDAFVDGDKAADAGDSMIEESDDFTSESEGSRITRAEYVKEITRAEANELKHDLNRKRDELKIAREKLDEAREAGDLSENEAYVHFREVVSGLESDIASIENDLKTSHIKEDSGSSNFIGIGSKVHLVITSKDNLIEKQDLIVTIVSDGYGGIIPETGEIRVPANSEVYRNMADMQVGSFDLTGLDGNNYHYEFEIYRGGK